MSHVIAVGPPDSDRPVPVAAARTDRTGPPGLSTGSTMLQLRLRQLRLFPLIDSIRVQVPGPVRATPRTRTPGSLATQPQPASGSAARRCRLGCPGPAGPRAFSARGFQRGGHKTASVLWQVYYYFGHVACHDPSHPSHRVHDIRVRSWMMPVTRTLVGRTRPGPAARAWPGLTHRGTAGVPPRAGTERLRLRPR